MYLSFCRRPVEEELERKRRAMGVPLDLKTLETLRGLTRGQYDCGIPKF